MGSNQSNCAKVIGYKATHVEFESAVFAEGKFRRVYRGTFHGDPRMEGKRCVVKVNIDPYSEDLQEYAWKADDRAYQKAQEMAEKFNKKYNTSKPIEFVKPEFTSIDTRAAFNFLGFIPFASGTKIPVDATVAVERYLEGDYVAFSNNMGYVTAKEMSTPGAFSHFTYDESNGEVLVCDLQGLRTDKSYKLTDPAVNSTGAVEYLYGPSDMGILGIVKFFENHKCNSLCYDLKKPKRAFDVTTGKEVKFSDIGKNLPLASSTMNTYQLETCGISKSGFKQLQDNTKLEN